jgi:autotransporter-associated beta strand protein
MASGTQVAPGTLTLGTTGGAMLEFKDVTSTTTAPLAPGTIASSGTVTVNINSGTFTVGQSYPLLKWTTGSTPTVSLGVLNGFVGNFTSANNTLSLNITGTAYLWTGANNGNWDLTAANNWVQNGVPAVFANGAPALFDDTSATTNVTIGGLVQPTTVTINNSIRNYSLTSTSGKAIGGSANLTKSGSGMLTLPGGANTYTGITTISGGPWASAYWQTVARPAISARRAVRRQTWWSTAALCNTPAAV